MGFVIFFFGVFVVFLKSIAFGGEKPENMLYRTKDKTSDLVIADFGLSKIMNQNTFDGLMTTCGTPVREPRKKMNPPPTSLSIPNKNRKIRHT